MAYINMIPVEQKKLFKNNGEWYFDIRNYYLNAARKSKKDLLLKLGSKKSGFETKTLSHKDLNKKNLVRLNNKEFNANYPAERYNVEVGDKYSLWSIKWDSELLK